LFFPKYLHGHQDVRISNLACSPKGSWCLPKIIYLSVLLGVRPLICPRTNDLLDNLALTSRFDSNYIKLTCVVSCIQLVGPNLPYLRSKEGTVSCHRLLPHGRIQSGSAALTFAVGFIHTCHSLVNVHSLLLI
jgi:hypothetical protein